jgi:hypothetical protein
MNDSPQIELEGSHNAPSEPPVSTVALRPRPEAICAPLAFELLGDVSVVIPTLRSEVCSSEGIALRVDATTLELALPDARSVTLVHNLPSSIHLSSLLGQMLRVTLVDDAADNTNGGASGATGTASQTLCISGVGGRVWLIARFGPVHGVVHSIGETEVRAALSQRPTGPLVVGTAELQWLVEPGCHVRLGGAALGLVVEHVARVSTESAAYVIAENALYAG